MGTWCAAFLAAVVARLCAAHRLPTHVVPEEYTLDIVTRLGDDGEDFGFDGRVSIKVRALNDTDNIILHSKGLEIDEEHIRVEDDSVSNDAAMENFYGSVTYVPKDELLSVKLSRPVTQGRKYVIHVPYVGNLSEGFNGYYRSSYRDQAGRTRWLAVTHFEPSAARKAFPCFDEPEMKARFQINLARRDHYRSASNMPIKTTEPMSGRPGWSWDRYETSPAMSTYLAAFMVADFRSADSDAREGVPVAYRIWARPEAVNQTGYALQVAQKVLEYYEQYFNVSYPLPKMDMVAVPDFGAGAMENWGLVTYRETTLLYDPRVTSTNQQMKVASVIAHELAHQWFGNLVTMKWWSDLWLNEGFATYVATLGVDHVHPEWDSLDYAALDNFLSTMSLDALKSSHSLSVAVNKPADISQIFDTISYQKGSTLLRMINHFLGEEVFRQGLSNYLSKHQYGNAEQDDLWASLDEEAHRRRALSANMTVKGIMDTWSLQAGYPVVSVTRDYQLGTAALTQERYLLDTTQLRDETGECWIIPLTYSSAREPAFEDTKPKHWMTCGGGVTIVPNMPGPDQWVVFNNRATGLYRVQYDKKNWLLISEALNSGEFQKISVLNRAQLLNDLMDFARTGDVDYDLALGAVKYLRQEQEYLPWRTASSAFRRLDTIMQRTPDYHHYRTYLKSLLKPSVERIDDIADIPEGFLEKNHHLQMVSWACHLLMGPCARKAAELFDEWTSVKDPDTENPIPRDLRYVVYCTAVKYGSEVEWDFVWQRYIASNIPSEKATLLSTLACSREPWLLRRLLQTAHTRGSPIRKQDSSSVFSAVCGGEVGYTLAKEYFEDNLAALHEFHQPNAGRLSRYIQSLARHMYTQKEFDEWRKFLTDNKELLSESDRTAQQAIESVQVNVLWHRDHYQHLSRGLQQHATT